MTKRLKNTLIYLAARLLLGLVRLLGWKNGRRFGRRLGRWAYRWAKRERQIALENLSLALPETSAEERQAIASEMFQHFGRAAAEVACIGRVRLEEFVDLEPASRAALEDALGQGRGVIYVTAHTGNWELMAQALARWGYPVNTIGRASYDPRFTRLIDKFRLAGGVRTLWRGEPELWQRMLEVLRRGELMGLLIDQDTDVPGEFAPFFGREAHTPSAPVLLAQKSGARLVVGFNHRRQPDGYRVVVHPFALEGDPAAPDFARRNLARLNLLIEQHVRAYPAEWVWMHRRWKTRPKDAGSDAL